MVRSVVTLAAAELKTHEIPLDDSRATHFASFGTLATASAQRWLLLEPPVDETSDLIKVLDEVPLAQWNRIGTYDREATCESRRNEALEAAMEEYLPMSKSSPLPPRNIWVPDAPTSVFDRTRSTTGPRRSRARRTAMIANFHSAGCAGRRISGFDHGADADEAHTVGEPPDVRTPLPCGIQHGHPACACAGRIPRMSWRRTPFGERCRRWRA